MSALVRYEQARTALAECARIDEASEIRDKAAALAAYARQRDDRDLEVWVREIHLRACVRIGELSRELEGADHGGQADGATVEVPAGGNVEGRRPWPMPASPPAPPSATRNSLAVARSRPRPRATPRWKPTSRSPAPTARRRPWPGCAAPCAVRVQATLGPPPPRTKRPSPPPEPPKVAPIGADWADWTAAVLTVATLPTDFASLAGRSPRALLADLRGEAREALQRLPLWINALENEHDHSA